jgi:hypothetical protein
VVIKTRKKLNKMVYENIIPKTETIYELKNKIPSYEEFMKTYQSNEASEFPSEAEYQDQALHGPRYGPGNTQSAETVTKKVLSVGLAVSYFTPLSAVTIPLSVGAGVASASMMTYGVIADDKEVGKVGAHMAEVLVDSATGDIHDQGKIVGKYIEYQSKR